MDSNRWQRLKELFDEALDLPTANRMAFAEKHCGDDHTLLAELKSLLIEEDSVLEMLDAAALDTAGVLEDVSKEGQRIGPYIVKRQLGVGGMGEVYLAERADGQFERQVALKLVRTGIHSEKIIARFKSERQILARLQHPNIGRMLDAGLSDDGQPYFVLEYIEGRPIDEYANEHRLDVNERLELFDQVCRAVTYAHAHLVVHRDLKPSNILVTDDGQVKLLDFGIAKVLSEEDGGDMVTQTGAGLMTPAYASPEQARGEPVNTSTDIYSLGVVLYELLTGLRPYQVDQGNPLEAARVICEIEPERPSTAVTSGRSASPSQSGSDSATRSSTTDATHGSDTGRLHRLLQGDLDVICLKALRKEPGRRYTTSDELGEDLRRYLNDEPILARSESTAYRLGKFVRRHRIGVGMAAAVILLITALVSFYAARLSQERDRARLEAEKAKQVAAFLQEAFSVPNPEEYPGEMLSARQVLDQGAERLEEELADQPEVLAQMLDVMGESYRGLGLHESALKLEEKALALKEQRYGERSDVVASSLNDLGRNYYRMGDYRKADSLHRLALDLRRSLFGNEHDDVATSLNNLGLMAERLGRYAEAESLLTEALKVKLDLHGPNEPSLAVSYNNLGRVADRQGDYRQALAHYDESLRLLHIEHEPPHPHIAIAMKNKADTEKKLARFAAAEVTYRRALSMTRDLYDPDHPRRATFLTSFARLLIETGSYDEARIRLAEAEEILMHAYGPGHPELTSAWSVQSKLAAATGDYERADSLRQKTLAINRERFGASNPRVAADLGLLSDLQLLMERPEAAAATRRKALAIRQEVYGDQHPYIASDMHGLAECLLALGQTEEAEDLARRALDMRTEFLGEGHPDVGETRALLNRLPGK